MTKITLIDQTKMLNCKKIIKLLSCQTEKQFAGHIRSTIVFYFIALNYCEKKLFYYFSTKVVYFATSINL